MWILSSAFQIENCTNRKCLGISSHWKGCKNIDACCYALSWEARTEGWKILVHSNERCHLHLKSMIAGQFKLPTGWNGIEKRVKTHLVLLELFDWFSIPFYSLLDFLKSFLLFDFYSYSLRTNFATYIVNNKVW